MATTLVYKLVMNNYQLSIIIAYYQTYDLTVQLLHELQKQYTSEVEIILVDDGCHETRLEKFDFIKIIHLDENHGASTALNTGIENATGKYIGFIDSDDMVSHNYIQSLLDLINKRDEEEIIFGWADKNTGKQYLHPVNIAIWKAIYRADFCPRFDPKWIFRTDMPFARKVRGTHHTRYYYEKVLYYYNSNREGSLTWRRLHEENIWTGKRL